MSYEKPALSLLLATAFAAAACTSPVAPDSIGSRSDALASGDALAALVALGAPGSEGGASLTPSEAATYVAEIPGFDGDSSVDALAVLARFSDAVSSPSIGSVTLALRHHVDGMRISGMRVDGLTLSSCTASGAVATFDPKGAPYTHVSVVYSGDGWQTSHAADLAPGAGGLYRGSLAGLDAHAHVTFAVALTQNTGEVTWLNNPRENSSFMTSHTDFRQAVDLCEPVASTSVPPFVRLVRAFALPESLGGADVTNDEVSWLVAQATYEGGTGIDDPDVIDPVVLALDAMASNSVTFEGSTYSIMRTFLTNMRMRTATSSVLTLVRGPTQYVIAAAPVGAQFMRLYYSTDGWNSPKVTECTPLGRAGLVQCGIGFLPIDTLVSYSAIIRYSSGPDQIVHAADGGNLFGKARVTR